MAPASRRSSASSVCSSGPTRDACSSMAAPSTRAMRWPSDDAWRPSSRSRCWPTRASRTTSCSACASAACPRHAPSRGCGVGSSASASTSWPAAWRARSPAERRGVSPSRALVLEPEVLLLDEPFAGLDAPTRAALVEDLGGILRADRVTTVLVTHERGEAQALADRVAVLMEGRVRQLDETARVFYAPVAEDVARF